jgi:hypothetical protein
VGAEYTEAFAREVPESLRTTGVELVERDLEFVHVGDVLADQDSQTGGEHSDDLKLNALASGERYDGEAGKHPNRPGGDADLVTALDGNDRPGDSTDGSSEETSDDPQREVGLRLDYALRRRGERAIELRLRRVLVDLLGHLSPPVVFR